MLDYSKMDCQKKYACTVAYRFFSLFVLCHYDEISLNVCQAKFFRAFLIFKGKALLIALYFIEEFEFIGEYQA
jgi:hypothetical protein